MWNRRHFLLGLLALSMGSLTSSCSAQKRLQIALLKNSIPPQLLRAFQQQFPDSTKLSFQAEPQLATLRKYLAAWQEKNQKPEEKNNRLQPLLRLINVQPPSEADLVTLGDYWLAEAIEKELIQPLAAEELPLWSELPSQWQKLVQRNSQGMPDEKGKIWGAPYRWGSTVIAYNRRTFAKEGWSLPQDWSVLWRPELRDRFSLLAHPREVIGLTLKELGHSYNTEDLATVPELEEELLKLDEQVKFYSSDAYIQPLILGDTDLAVGWSTDFLPLQESYPDIAVVMPASGTALWSDIWVQPANANFSRQKGEDLSFLEKWINFCWQATSAQQISLFTDGASPVLLSIPPRQLPEDLRNNPLLLPEEEILEASEFLLPLPEKAVQQYEKLWQQLLENSV